MTTEITSIVNEYLSLFPLSKANQFGAFVIKSHICVYVLPE